MVDRRLEQMIISRYIRNLHFRCQSKIINNNSEGYMSYGYRPEKENMSTYDRLYSRWIQAI
jgi:hypothetical protein